MFLGSALTRGSQPPENILKFNLRGPLAENMATGYFAVKTTFFNYYGFPSEVRPLYVSTL
jgi:hypothetical protein